MKAHTAPGRSLLAAGGGRPRPRVDLAQAEAACLTGCAGRFRRAAAAGGGIAGAPCRPLQRGGGRLRGGLGPGAGGAGRGAACGGAAGGGEGASAPLCARGAVRWAAASGRVHLASTNGVARPGAHDPEGARPGKGASAHGQASNGEWLNNDPWPRADGQVVDGGTGAVRPCTSSRTMWPS